MYYNDIVYMSCVLLINKPLYDAFQESICLYNSICMTKVAQTWSVPMFLLSPSMPKCQSWSVYVSSKPDQRQLVNIRSLRKALSCCLPVFPFRYFVSFALLTFLKKCNIKVHIRSIEIKWDGKKQNYDTITRWDEYERPGEMKVIYSA